MVPTRVLITSFRSLMFQRENSFRSSLPCLKYLAFSTCSTQWQSPHEAEQCALCTHLYYGSIRTSPQLTDSLRSGSHLAPQEQLKQPSSLRVGLLQHFHARFGHDLVPRLSVVPVLSCSVHHSMLHVKFFGSLGAHRVF